MFRADRVGGKGKVEGSLVLINGASYIAPETFAYKEDFADIAVMIMPETLEIFLFGSWHLVSELETKYKLCRVFPIIKNYDSVTITSMPQPKRKPLANGTLPLTSEELKEFAKIMNTISVSNVSLMYDSIYYDDYCDCNTVEKSTESVKAILYLANLFDLTED